MLRKDIVIETSHIRRVRENACAPDRHIGFQSPSILRLEYPLAILDHPVVEHKFHAAFPEETPGLRRCSRRVALEEAIFGMHNGDFAIRPPGRELASYFRADKTQAQNIIKGPIVA